MKRTVLFIMILAAITAYAGPKLDMPGMNGAMPPQPGCDNQQNPPMPQMKDEMKRPVSLTKEEARGKFTAFMADKMKGFDIKEVNTIYMPFGTLHQATVTDKNGNKFYLDIAPDGGIKGPFIF